MGQDILGCGTVTLTETEESMQVPRDKEGDESWCLAGAEFQLGMKKVWRWTVGRVAQQCECV